MSNDATTMLGSLFEQADPEEFINFRLIRVDGTAVEKFLPASDISAAAEWALMRRGAGNLYVGVLPRTRQSGGRDAIRQAGVVWADCDSPESVAALEAFPLAPSIVVRSGSGENVHAYWILEQPIDLDRVEQLNKRLAAELGGDKVHDAARVLRLPSTLNHKHDPPTEVELVDCSGARHAVADIESILPEVFTGPQAHTTEKRKQSALADSGPTQMVLGRLEGVRKTSNDWSARCPAHDDQRPSLSVAEADDGRCLVHCFAGCAAEAVVTAIGLELADLFPDHSPQGRRGASRLIDLAEHTGLDLFHTPAGVAHAAITVGGHRETWRVGALEFSLWLRKLHYEHTSEGVPSDQINEAVATLEARAQFGGEEREVHLRVGGDHRRVVIDVGDATWRAIEVTADGWALVDHPDVHFIRDRTTLPLPEPAAGGSIDELRDFANCANERSFLLLAGTLVMCFHPSGPYPIGYVTGEQGSAKSTVSRAMVSLADPRKAPLAMGNPTVKDLVAIANSVRVVGFDNVSKITPALSDALCQLATGAGYRARELYTNADAFSLDLKRLVLINGIGQAANRPDLLDRVALIELAPIPPKQRRTEDEFWAAWNEARPRILGALLDGVASALLNAPELELAGFPRLADFARWGEAAGMAWGWQPGAFTAALETGREDLLEGSADAYPEIATLIGFMEQHDGEAWGGTATELLAKLGDVADEAVTGSQTWPKKADTLSNRLVEHAPLLRQHGIEVQRGREAGGKRKRFLRVTVGRDDGTRRDA